MGSGAPPNVGAGCGSGAGRGAKLAGGGAAVGMPGATPKGRSSGLPRLSLILRLAMGRYAGVTPNEPTCVVLS